MAHINSPWMNQLRMVMCDFLNLGIDVMFTAQLLKYNLITFQDQDRILAETTDERKCLQLFKILLRHGPECETTFKKVLQETDRQRFITIFDNHRTLEYNTDNGSIPVTETGTLTIQEITEDDDDDTTNPSKGEPNTTDNQDLEITSLHSRIETLELEVTESNSKVIQLQSKIVQVYKHLPPSKPELVKAAVHGTIFRWQHHFPRELDVTGYKIVLKEVNGTENILERRYRENDEYELPDLKLDVKYEISVCTIFEGCYESVYGPSVTFTPIPPPGQPEPILPLTKHNKIAIKWHPSPYQTMTVSHYHVQYKTSNGHTDTMILIQANLTQMEKLIIGDLKPGEVYMIRTCSVFKEGISSGYSDFTKVHTRPTSPPRNVTWKKVIKSFHTEVEWRKPSHIGKDMTVENYVIQRRKGKNGDQEQWSVSALQSETGDYSLCVPGYWWDVECLRVKAVCGIGEPEIKYHSEWCEFR